MGSSHADGVGTRPFLIGATAARVFKASRAVMA